MAQPESIAGRYQVNFGISDLLGRGGMGAVYRGIDLQTQQLIAVKVLRPEIVTASPWLVQRFVREGEALRRLNHPNIVKMLASTQEGDAYYIVMEYVPGGSLYNLLVQQPDYRLAVDRVLRIGVELADALARAHHLRVIHRDIKPANILLAADGTPRLTDFGIARMGDLTSVTEAGEVVGTYSYLCPEGFHGRELDARADIWSFGVVLFEMLSGDVPFKAHQPGGIMMAILNNPVPDLETLRPDAPIALVDLIYRMLEKNPGQRINSARLVAAELEAIIRNVDTDFHPLVFLAHLPSELSPTHDPTPRYHNLPPQATPFVGRERELAEIRARLSAPECRLLTLIGPGGIGKTRLAIQAAMSQVTAFTGGVFFVPLAGIASPDVLTATIADVMGFTFSGARDAMAQLIEHMRTTHVLLVMDNFEHVVDGAGLLTEILEAAANVKILATSRESLHLHGEWLLEIQGMDFPAEQDGGAIESYSAARLFVQGAERVQPGYVLTESDKSHLLRLCRLVGGMPLAIELASSWVRMLSLGEIADEIAHNLDFLESTMRDIPERHRSIRAVFEYSWNTLSPGEKDVFKRLAVLQGGFHRDAALQIAGASLMVLSALVNKSLLWRAPSGRYEVHNLLRQYAERKLEGTLEEWASLRHIHCRYYAEFLHRREAMLGGPNQSEAIAEVSLESENLRAALDWAVERSMVNEISALLSGMFLFLDVRGWYTVGQELLTRVVNRLEGLPDSPERNLTLGRALRYQSMFYQSLGSYEPARLMLDEALTILHTLDAPLETGNVLRQLGSIAYATGDYDSAAGYYRETMALYTEVGDLSELCAPLMRLGDIATVQGDYNEARLLLLEALRYLTGQNTATPGPEGSLRTRALCLANLGDVSCKLGEYKEAQQYFEQCRSLSVRVGDRRGTAIALVNLGRVARALGEFDLAIQLCRESETICEETGNRWGMSFALAHLGMIYCATGDYDQAEELLESSANIAAAIGNRWGKAFAQNQLAFAALAVGRIGDAWGDLFEALRLAAEIKALPLILDALAGMGRCRLAEGRYDGAAALLHLALEHPASEHETKLRARQALDMLAAQGNGGDWPLAMDSPLPELYDVVGDLLAAAG